jgi:hypothetical protein
MAISNGTKASPRRPVEASPAPGETPSVDGDKQFLIPRITPKIIVVEITGTSPLLVNAWSKKARQMMLDKQMKKAKRGRDAKVPEEDYKNSLYISTEGWTGIPAGGMKGCLVNACRACDIPMTMAKRMIRVLSQGVTADGKELVRIYGNHVMDESPVRIDNGGTADIRFRARYDKWSCKLEVSFLENIISAEQVLNLIEMAGWIEGLCGHRPGSPKSNTGSNGCFEVKRNDE